MMCHVSFIKKINTHMMIKVILLQTEIKNFDISTMYIIENAFALQM
jgi:hypothetical protein